MTKVSFYKHIFTIILHMYINFKCIMTMMLLCLKNDLEETRALFTKLTRQAGRRYFCPLQNFLFHIGIFYSF